MHTQISVSIVTYEPFDGLKCRTEGIWDHSRSTGAFGKMVMGLLETHKRCSIEFMAIAMEEPRSKL